MVNRKKVRGVAPPVDVDTGRGDYRFGRWEASDWHTPFPLRSGAIAKERGRRSEWSKTISFCPECERQPGTVRQEGRRIGGRERGTSGDGRECGPRPAPGPAQEEER